MPIPITGMAIDATNLLAVAMENSASQERDKEWGFIRSKITWFTGNITFDKNGDA